MTTKKLGNILVKSSIIGAMSLTYAGCGIQVQKQAIESAAENSTDLKKGPADKASLALALPANLPAAVDELEVTLSRGHHFVQAKNGSKPSPTPSIHSGVTNWITDSDTVGGVFGDAVNGDVLFTQIFQIKDQAIQINDLEAGDYWITVKLVESNSGRTYSHGEGTATVQAGQDATVHISMTKVDATTGGLVIVLDDASVSLPFGQITPKCLACEDIKTRRAPPSPDLVVAACPVGIPNTRHPLVSTSSHQQ